MGRLKVVQTQGASQDQDVGDLILIQGTLASILMWIDKRRFNHFSVLVKIAFLQSDAIKNSLRDQHPILNLLAKVAMWSYKLACDPSGPFFFSNPL